MRKLRILLSVLLLLGSCAVSLPTRAAAMAGSGTVQHQYQGTLGSSSIGMTIVRVGNTIKGGHYFYRKYLEDIPLTGTEQDSTVTLREPGGGTFHLHFTGNGSNGTAPLDFENSIGMEGTWTRPDGLHTDRVLLRGTAIEYGNPDDRYASITSAPAAVFEKRVQSLVRAVLAGDRTTAIRFISYPLSVNLANGERKRCHTPAEVLAAWDEIFTAALVEDLRKDLPHDMFVHEGAAMLGNGEAWFDAKGLSTVNVPAAANHKAQ